MIIGHTKCKKRDPLTPPQSPIDWFCFETARGISLCAGIPFSRSLTAYWSTRRAPSASIGVAWLRFLRFEDANWRRRAKRRRPRRLILSKLRIAARILISSSLARSAASTANRVIESACAIGDRVTEASCDRFLICESVELWCMEWLFKFRY